MENILQDSAKGLRFIKYIALRYFNVAGSDLDDQLGKAYKEPTLLITRALKTAKGEFSKLLIYRTDYNTPDGTCIRDYIHVSDIAGAHLCALNYLKKTDLIGTDNGSAMNCGYSHGFSVREVVTMTRKVTGIDFTFEEAARRPGDSPSLIANSGKIKNNTGWTGQYDNLEFIIKTAWEWEKKR